MKLTITSNFKPVPFSTVKVGEVISVFFEAWQPYTSDTPYLHIVNLENPSMCLLALDNYRLYTIRPEQLVVIRESEVLIK